MKINRFFALAAIALLVVGAMGFVSYRSNAQATDPTATNTQDCNTDEADDALEDQADAPDNDNVDFQCGDQFEDETEDLDGDETEEQSPAYTGSLTVDEAQYEGLSEADESAALEGLAAISASEAEAAALAANPGTSVVKTELDNENGVVVYSVELNNGADVKVDAGNAAVIHTESDGDFEG